MTSLPTEHVYQLSPLYQGWDAYQRRLADALAPLTAQELTLRVAPHLRSVGEVALHIIGARARWMHEVLGEGGEAMVSLGKWDDDDQPSRSGAELAGGMQTTWEALRDALDRWTPADWQETLRVVDAGQEEVFSRQWVVWHLLEHDLHHGGELSFLLGANGIPAIDI